MTKTDKIAKKPFFYQKISIPLDNIKTHHLTHFITQEL
jgi:hypothetical protein